MTSFTKMILEHKVSVLPDEIDRNMNDILLPKVKDQLGNKCHKYGYIKKESIQIVQRSLGAVESSHFNGNIIYHVKIEADVCIPMEGQVIKCTVIGKNKMGILAKSPPMLIVLSKIHHQNLLQKFDEIKTGDTLNVKVLCSKFELNSKEISVVGKLL